MAKLRVLHLVPSLDGGAGRAATRIHQCLNYGFESCEVSSSIRCLQSRSVHGPSIQVGYPSRRVKYLSQLKEKISTISKRHFQADTGVFHSFGYPGIGIHKIVNQGPFDLIHLHWCGGNLITIEEIGLIKKPIVWTLHDQWAFCGAEHYASSSSSGDYRYPKGYNAENRARSERGPDLNQRTWNRKLKAWKKPFQIVAPSRWLASCVQESCLMQHWPIAVIPHPINTNVWRPLNKEFARETLNLPQGKPIILFGVDTGCAKPNKGADLLMRALFMLSEAKQLAEGFELAVFGQRLAQHQLPPGLSYHFLGRFSDDVMLRLAYAAADVLVMPSRKEAFGLTAAEAHACGTPVVCFNGTGVADIVDHKITGAIAQPFEPGSLARSIAWVIQDQERCALLGQAARRKAADTWAEPIIANQYLNLYFDAKSLASAKHSLS